MFVDRNRYFFQGVAFFHHKSLQYYPEFENLFKSVYKMFCNINSLQIKSLYSAKQP